ncbi:MAG TPA: PVC-type heme-binding CxxCH protein, partial [Opitutales bacterium]|nr:PVC-type heme-binding CxxCH protein [Opitutales bacterium]
MNGPPFLLLFHFLIFATLSVGAAVPEVDPEDLPRIPPTEPADALETFEIKDGFKIELVASEPIVVDPVAISFDENGQLYVIEMIDYSERRDETLGRVMLLRDTDGDGIFNESIVFAEGLGWPTAIICYDGGVFVASSPDIIWLKDTDGDGRADERKTVFTGFGSHMKRLNVQALLNNLTWGLDNRIHG